MRPEIAKYRKDWLPGLDSTIVDCYERLGRNDLRLKAAEQTLKDQPDDLQARWTKVQSLLLMGKTKVTQPGVEIGNSKLGNSEAMVCH